MKSRSFLIWGTIFLSVLLMGCAKIEKVGGEGEAVAAGQVAPQFSVTLNDGSSYKLSDSQGKVTLINIWATWCGPCCAEMPDFQRLYEEFGDDLQIVAVNYGESKQEVDDFVSRSGYTFPFAYDEDLVVSKLYPSIGIPYTVIIDKDGNVLNTYTGIQSEDGQYELYKAVIEEAVGAKN